MVLYTVGLLGRSSALQAEETGSIPVLDASINAALADVVIAGA
jgi:hypothetical protein